MPAAFKRACSYPGGCHELVTDGGRCPVHQRSRDSRRGKTAARGYDASHKRLRVLCLERDGFRCVDCGWEPDLVKRFRDAGLGLPPTSKVLEQLADAFAHNERHLHADHEIPVEERPDLRLSLENYRTRCNVCHSRKTAREDGGFGNVLQASATGEVTGTPGGPPIPATGAA